MAMVKARELVSDYVRAGITKIHLDCSEGCAGEPPLIDNETAADRAASLAISCLDAASAPEELLFVIGTEVPPPGGARLDDNGHVIPTSPVSAAKTLIAHHNAFANKGIADLWPQVAGLVVQPGVELDQTKFSTYRQMSTLVFEMLFLIIQEFALKRIQQIISHLRHS